MSNHDHDHDHDRGRRAAAAVIAAAVCIAIPAAWSAATRRDPAVVDPAWNEVDMLRAPESTWRGPGGGMIPPSSQGI